MTSITREMNRIEEDVYPIAVALGQAAGQIPRAYRRILGHDLSRVSSEMLKWTDVIDFMKVRTCKFQRGFGDPIPNLAHVLAPYQEPGGIGFGKLFLKVAQGYLLPTYIAFVREQGYDLNAENFDEAAQAHSLVLRLFKKAISQMLTECEYRWSFQSR